jgi:signal transduction histidine kinase
MAWLSQMCVSADPESDQVAGRRKALRNARRRILANVGKSFAELRRHGDEEYGRLMSDLEAFREREMGRVDRALTEATGSTSIEEALVSDVGDVSVLVAEMSRDAERAIASIEQMRESLSEYIAQFFEEKRDALLVAQTDEIEELREVVDQNLHLVQLGLAVEIIDHELNRLYDGIKQSLSILRGYVRNAPRSSQLLEQLQASFQTIEQRYKLMSPLYRASYRKPTEISGTWVHNYVTSFMERPLREYGVDFVPTESFLRFTIREVPAVVLPVYVNLVDNMIYWIREAKERRIELDVIEGVVTVCDSGPGIHETLLEEVFEVFFTTKPRGRGLGLYVARQNLQRFGHEIWATNDQPYHALSGACFCIRFHKDVVVKEQPE